MLDAFTRFVPACQGSSRREFLRLGSLGVAGLALTGAARAGHAGTTATAAKARSAILVFLGGGLSHIDTFDPKPDAPSTIRGAYGAMTTSVPGLAVSDRLPRMAGMMERVALVRSFAHSSNHHETAANWVLSGKPGSPFGDHPAVGAVVAHELGAAEGVPPYVAVPRNPAFTWELGKSAFLGERYESFPAGAGGRVAGPAFDLDLEPARMRDRYGRTSTGQSMLLARRLVEHGARFVTVSSAGWDHHAGIAAEFDRRLPEFDAALAALVADMGERGLLAGTLLVVVSEFGRVPQLNRAAGRDHWPHAGSILLAGAGITGGALVGRTDPHGAFVADRPVSPADLAQTILAALGIDPHETLNGPGGRPTTILDTGAPIRELWA